jgi:hypothetical protein
MGVATAPAIDVCTTGKTHSAPHAKVLHRAASEAQLFAASSSSSSVEAKLDRLLGLLEPDSKRSSAAAAGAGATVKRGPQSASDPTRPSVTVDTHVPRSRVAPLAALVGAVGLSLAAVAAKLLVRRR